MLPDNLRKISPASIESMRHIDFAIQLIQLAVTRVSEDPFTPIPTSPEVADYLVDLAERYPEDDSALSRFVIYLDRHAIGDELISQSLPDDIRGAVLSFKAEYHDLQVRMESELATGNWDHVRDYRGRQRSIADAISNLTTGIRFLATPELVESALASLGFDAGPEQPDKEK